MSGCVARPVRSLNRHIYKYQGERHLYCHGEQPVLSGAEGQSNPLVS